MLQPLRFTHAICNANSGGLAEDVQTTLHGLGSIVSLQRSMKGCCSSWEGLRMPRVANTNVSCRSVVICNLAQCCHAGSLASGSLIRWHRPCCLGYRAVDDLQLLWPWSSWAAVGAPNFLLALMLIVSQIPTGSPTFCTITNARCPEGNVSVRSLVQMLQ